MDKYNDYNVKDNEVSEVNDSGHKQIKSSDALLTVLINNHSSQYINFGLEKVNILPLWQKGNCTYVRG